MNKSGNQSLENISPQSSPNLNKRFFNNISSLFSKNSASSQNVPSEDLIIKIRSQHSLFSSRVIGQKTYKNVICGRELISWLVSQKYASDRVEAVKICQKFFEEEELKSVSDESCFRDENVYYRFVDDEPPSIQKLNSAIKSQNLKEVQEILKDHKICKKILNPKEIFDRNMGEFPPLITAILEETSEQIMSLLLEAFKNYKLDINLATDSGNTYLHFICLEIGKMNTNPPSRVIPNFIILLSYNKLKAGVQNKDGNTALHYYSQKSSSLENEEVIRLMKERGVNLGSCNKIGETALHRACMNVNDSAALSIIHCLIKEGVNINSVTNSGDTALHYAVRMNRLPIMKLLLDNQIDYSLTNKQGESAKDLALKSGIEEIEKIFQNISDDTSTSSFNVPPIPLLVRRASPIFDALDLPTSEIKKSTRMRTASISINHHRATLKLSRSSEIKKRELAVTPIEFFETVTKIESQSIEINPDEEKKKKKLEREYVKNLLKGNTEKLAKKGKLTNQEVNWLLERAKDSKEAEHQLAATRCLTAAAFPNENIIGIRALILRSGLFDIIQGFVAQSLLTVHTEIPSSDIEKISFIAEGAAAKVYKAKWKGKIVALKVFDPEHIAFSEEEFKKEVSLLCILENENLVKCYGACLNNRTEFFIVSEYMHKGNLLDVLTKNPIDMKTKIRFARDIARGLRWLHSMKLIHRDLKSRNILLNEALECKIIDFGTSRSLKSDKIMTKNIGTPAWIAPEVFLTDNYTEKADVYSFGIIMWEIISGQEPYAKERVWAIPQKVCEENLRPSPIPQGAPEKYVEIMKKAWSGSANERPSILVIENQLNELLTILN